jgi:microcystin-dependent protein
MPSNTTNFQWLKPTVAGDNDIWGDELNSNLDSQDSLIRSFMNSFIGATAPTTAQAGTLWLNNTTSPYVYSIYDGTNWAVIGSLNPTAHTFTGTSVSAYIGDMKFSAQSANHGSWILCNGQSLDTTTYSGLFAVIGYSFGGSGATFFAPNMQGQVAGAIGQGSYVGATNRTSGQFVGGESTTLSVPNMPSHSHTINTANVTGAFSSFDGPFAGNILPGSAGLWTNSTSINIFSTQINPTGSGASFTNMQPTLFVGNYFIYSGA